MNKAQAYELACELEAAQFIRKLREREARARFTDEPLTGFGPMEPEDTEATETTQ